MNATFRQIKPHIIAILIGFIVIFTYFPSAFLESKVIDMGDIKRHRATTTEAYHFRDSTGIEPLWTNSLFGGMPLFQINTKYDSNLLGEAEHITNSILPPYLDIIFMLFIGFYFLGISLGYKPWISMLGGFAFAFSSFFIISLAAGHTGKLHATEYIAFTFIGILMTMRGKLLLGGALTCLFLSLAISANHFQITYYMAMMIVAYMIVEFYFHFKEKNLKPFLQKSGVLVAAALLAIGPNISRLWTNIDYAGETMRGGKSELKEYKDAEGGGLEKDYAMRWSYGTMETFTLLIPNFYGGATTYPLGENSNTGKELRKRGIPERQLTNILSNMPVYWGDQPFVSGPVYVGAIIVFFVILGLFILHGRLKVWLISCIIFSIVLSWGNNFELVTDFFFYYVPMFNKFRTPSMILTVTIFAMVLMAIMTLNKLQSSQHGIAAYMPEIRKTFFIVGGVCLFFMLFGSSLFSFTGASDEQLRSEGWPMESLIKDRQEMMTWSSLRSLVLVSLTFLLLWMYSKNRVSPKIFMAVLFLGVVVDMWTVDKSYLNEANFVKERGLFDFYQDTPADQAILQDPDPNFRVFNVTVNPFTDALTSFHHKSIGGYHGAKLIRYQDIIDRHLSKNNTKVIDMLNTKYYIVQNQETGQPEAKRNPGALGNAWFVNNIVWADNADQEIEALNTFTPATDVVIDKRFKDEVDANLNLNKAASNIKLTKYRPNHLTYEADVTGGKQFAVFSEIYYEGTDHDWKSFIDGQPVSHIRVNYILRGMEIPEGHHTIEFKFEPISYIQGERYSFIFSIVIIVVLVVAIGFEIWNNMKKSKEKAVLDQEG